MQSCIINKSIYIWTSFSKMKFNLKILNIKYFLISIYLCVSFLISMNPKIMNMSNLQFFSICYKNRECLSKIDV